ncbi:MAG: 2-oxoacid:acceptor oxidoreductase family protein, partial [Gammaproteobacteria bacterium]|nr:2-oxoacid:acceptor oxidoreductase family protein [Gammaproteobacteria bacterium]
MIEMRGHARGGQGMVTAFEILAKIFAETGEFMVQSFPAFGVERTGAPIQAFLRLSRSEIHCRSNIYSPHLIVVFDEKIIEQVPVFNGLRDNGIILLNTTKPASAFRAQAKNVFTIHATNISMSKGLGSRSLPIVNSAMIGAICRILGVDIEAASKIIRHNVPAKAEANVESAKIAYNSVDFAEGSIQNIDEFIKEAEFHKSKHIEKVVAHSSDEHLSEVVTPSWQKPMTINKTGSWRVLTPAFENKAAPCMKACPAGTDVRKFVKEVGERDFQQAYKTIYEHNPFPSICGRVCPNFCEQGCNRRDFDKALNIGAIERFVGDIGVQSKILPIPVFRKEKVAIIGSGPAGLTAALRLRQHGYDTTVFESLPAAGGMMRTGIPEFRLPGKVLDADIKRIQDAGVNIKLNSKRNIEDLENDYNAVIAAVGSHIGASIGISKENKAHQGIDFLREFKLNGNRFGIKQDDEVMIIGGGNTAVDVARTAIRLGAKATIFYRRTRMEMPAIYHEVDEAIAEGVKLEFLCAPVNIEESTDGSLAVQMVKMRLDEPDDSGRRRPVIEAGSEYLKTVNHVILAVGQSHDNQVFCGNDVKPTQGSVCIVSHIPIFCAGDMAWGGTVAEAIGSGNEVAREVMALFDDQDYQPTPKATCVVTEQDIKYTYYKP